MRCCFRSCRQKHTSFQEGWFVSFACQTTEGISHMFMPCYDNIHHRLEPLSKAILHCQRIAILMGDA